MKLRALQILFVAAALFIAAFIIHQGKPRLLPATQAQGTVTGGLTPVRPRDAAAAVASIQAQLTAFRKNDFQTAIRYQSSGLMGSFPSADMFRGMMQQAYPAFLHFQSASYHVIGSPDNDHTVVVFVTLHMKDHSLVQAVYMMVREASGYRVQGVQGGVPGFVNPAPVPVNNRLT